jgi:hypothetical protein
MQGMETGKPGKAQTKSCLRNNSDGEMERDTELLFKNLNGNSSETSLEVELSKSKNLVLQFKSCGSDLLSTSKVEERGEEEKEEVGLQREK